MRPAEDPSWGAYSRTILEFGCHPPFRIDLRRPLARSDRERVEALGLGSSFVILTACNPRGRTVSPELNAAATSALLARLQSLELKTVPTDGVAVDGGHREAGFAVALPGGAARALAIELGQSAYFGYEQGVFFVFGALVDVEPIRLPVPC